MKFLRFATSLLIFSAIGFFVVNGFFKKSCKKTISYSIGSFDERFHISRQEFLGLLYRAENSWESVLGYNIFDYREGGDFKVNLIFGKEQEQIQKMDSLLAELDELQVAIEKHEKDYLKAFVHYQKLSKNYKRKLSNYEKDVSLWNNKGGAPKEEYEKLLLQKKKLDTLFLQVEQAQKKVNILVESNNREIKNYNTQVEKYNKIFPEEREFEVGDTDLVHQINIHSFKNKDELYSILMHELGHVLGLDHLKQPESVMYYLLNEKNNKGVLSREDILALKEKCHIK